MLLSAKLIKTKKIYHLKSENVLKYSTKNASEIQTEIVHTSLTKFFQLLPHGSFFFLVKQNFNTF